MIKIKILTLILFGATQIMCAQLTDLSRVEYTYFPQGDSENSFKRFRAFVNVPLKVSEDGYLVPGFEYRNVFLKLQDGFMPGQVGPFIKNELEHYQSFNFSLGYTNKLKNSWRYAFQAELRVSSNFESSIVSDDFIIGGSIYMINDKTKDEQVSKPWRLVLGLNYSTTAGRPFPLPFVNYYREFAPKWTFGLGVPKSNIKYEFVKDMKLQGFVTLDGFFANIQNDVSVVDPAAQGDGVAQNISMTTLLSGIGYEWEFINHFVFFVYGGHTIINDIRLENNNNDPIYTINDTGSFYTRGGIKCKI